MTYQLRSRHPLAVSSASALAVSPDARFVAFSSRDNKLHIHDAATGAEVKRIHIGADPQGLAFSPDSQFVATGSKTIHLYDTTTWKPAGELKGHRHTINDLGFSADGTLAYTCSGDHYTPADWSVRAWDASGVEQHRWKADQDVKQLAVSPTGMNVAASMIGGQLAILTAALAPVHVLPKPEAWDDMEMLTFSADGRSLFAVGSEVQTVHVIDVATGAQRELKLAEQATRAWGLVEGNLLVWNGALTAVDPASGAAAWTVPNSGSVDEFAVTPDESVLVTIGGSPTELVVYDRVGGVAVRKPAAASAAAAPAEKPAPAKKPAAKKKPAAAKKPVLKGAAKKK